MPNPAPLKEVVRTVKEIQDAVPSNPSPPDEPDVPQTSKILPHSLTNGTRAYISKVAFQINGAYEKGWFDACAVMMRRLMETLLIEVFEHHNCADEIKDTQGDYLSLDVIIGKARSGQFFKLSRDARRKLAQIKKLGDTSAHNRYYTAHKSDIDNEAFSFRVIVHELLECSGMIEQQK